jgi:hypothetical protein
MVAMKQNIWRYGKKSTIGSVLLILTIIGVGWLLSVEPAGPATQNTNTYLTTTPAGGSAHTIVQHPNVAASNASLPKTSTSPGVATTVCDGVFSSSAAAQVLGAGASADASNGVTSQTADTTVMTCAYSNNSGSATVVVHRAHTTIGASSNEVAFGSGRPSGVTAVSGYGSSAFWQSTSSELNILHDNDWYVIASSAGTLTSAEQVAQAAHLNS